MSTKKPYELDPSVRITAESNLSTRPPQWWLDVLAERRARRWWRRWFA